MKSPLFTATLLLCCSTASYADYSGNLFPFANGQLLADASNTWVVPPGVSRIRACVAAAGGGGGGVGAVTSAASGAGGSSGEAICADMTVTPGQSFAYTNDTAGGAGGVGSGASGSNGGNSTFGPLTASGGQGGGGITTSGNGVAATGTVINTLRHSITPSTSVTMQLEAMGLGAAGTSAMGGSGGITALYWGAPAAPPTTSSSAGASTGYGAGGSGAYAATGTGPFNGGKGSPGATFVRW